MSFPGIDSLTCQKGSAPKRHTWTSFRNREALFETDTKSGSLNFMAHSLRLPASQLRPRPECCRCTPALKLHLTPLSKARIPLKFNPIRQKTTFPFMLETVNKGASALFPISFFWDGFSRTIISSASRELCFRRLQSDPRSYWFHDAFVATLHFRGKGIIVL